MQDVVSRLILALIGVIVGVLLCSGGVTSRFYRLMRWPLLILGVLIAVVYALA